METPWCWQDPQGRAPHIQPKPPCTKQPEAEGRASSWEGELRPWTQLLSVCLSVCHGVTHPGAPAGSLGPALPGLFLVGCSSGKERFLHPCSSLAALVPPAQRSVTPCLSKAATVSPAQSLSQAHPPGAVVPLSSLQPLEWHCRCSRCPGLLAVGMSRPRPSKGGHSWGFTLPLVSV